MSGSACLSPLTAKAGCGEQLGKIGLLSRNLKLSQMNLWLINTEMIMLTFLFAVTNA